MKLNSGEAFCPHCGQIIYQWFVRLWHRCPACQKTVKKNDLIFELFSGEGVCRHCGKIIYLWYVANNHECPACRKKTEVGNLALLGPTGSFDRDAAKAVANQA